MSGNTKLIELKEEYDWNKLIDIPKLPVLIYFYAPWCAPCSELEPIVNLLSQEYKDITFFNYNMDKLRMYAAQFDIVGIPTILLMKTNEAKEKMFVFDRIKGFQSVDMLRTRIEAFKKATMA